MPIYEYECQECGRRSEEIQKLSDPPLTECSNCSGRLKKLISSPAIQFKGSGWYVNDYGKSGSGGGDKGGEDSGGGTPSTSDSSKGEAGSGSKGESKGGGSESSGASTKSAASKES